MTDIEKLITNRIISFFRSQSQRMIEDLKGIINGDFGLYDENSREEIAFLDFEISPDGFSAYFCPSDLNYNQLGYKETLTNYPAGFLSEDSIWQLEKAEYDEEELSADRSEDYYDNLEKEYINWFTDCWDKTDGPKALYDF